MKKLWIKCPFPGEKPGEGKWFECNTVYLRYLWKKHHNGKYLPTVKQEDDPNEVTD